MSLRSDQLGVLFDLDAEGELIVIGHAFALILKRCVKSMEKCIKAFVSSLPSLKSMNPIMISKVK